ncbi:hypothetical protein ScPMuIL_013197 [Solemya velum]
MDVGSQIPAAINSPSKQFYRRPLPDQCIAFSSEEGKRVFRSAMSEGFMECYFKLAAQFSTQDEPAYCGLTTLVMILNALDIDPGKVWKGPWRWYHENMLDCCVPLHIVEKQGIDFDQLVCVGNCNSLDIEARRASESTEDEFRQLVRRYTAQDNAFLVLSYSRPVLGQTGTGHFSPVGGYSAERDLVLLLDVARFKYPPHWVSLSLVWKAMLEKDKATGETRGYMIVSRQSKNNSLVLFRLAPCLSATLPCVVTESMATFLTEWQLWLTHQATSQRDDEIIETAILKFFTTFIKCGTSILTTQFDLKCIQDLSQEHISLAANIMRELEETALFQAVQNSLHKSVDSDEVEVKSTCLKPDCCRELEKECQWCGYMTSAHFLTVFFLSWPYKAATDCTPDSNAYIFLKHVRALQSKVGEKLLFEEIISIRKQLSYLLNQHKKAVCKENGCQLSRVAK